MFNKLISQFSFRKLQIGNCKLEIPRVIRARDGLTMIELLLVLAIVSIISVTSFAAFSNISSSKNIKNTLDEIEAVTVAAQKKSVTQENGKRWGVRFENSSTRNGFSLFSGTSFASGTVSSVSAFRRGVAFTNPSASSTYDVIFDPLTGFLSEDKIFTIASLKKDGVIGDVVLNTLGKVTKRYDYGLVGYWHFDEMTSSTAYDASGRGNNGTLINGPTWQPGTSCKAGGCLSFDTAAQKYISIPSNSSLNAKLTLEAWIYPTGVGGSDGMGTIILGSGAYYLSFNDSANALSCYWYGTTPAGYHTTPSNSVLLNQWSHVACVWDGTNINQYINGVLKNTVAVTGSGNSSGSLIVGAENSTRQFQGQIDEIRVYSRALSASEILAAYNDLK